jgi:hypothetical protein
MIASSSSKSETTTRIDKVTRLDSEMVELSLLLPARQAEALAAAADSRGLTTAQMLRRIIRDFCDRASRS